MIAAPASWASSAEAAISAGVTGTAGFISGVGALPVTAQVMMILPAMRPSPLIVVCSLALL